MVKRQSQKRDGFRSGIEILFSPFLLFLSLNLIQESPFLFIQNFVIILDTIISEKQSLLYKGIKIRLCCYSKKNTSNLDHIRQY